jgi:hypothetical protein
LARYQLQFNEGKTRLVPFSKRGQRQGSQQEGFDFLGFSVLQQRGGRFAMR